MSLAIYAKAVELTPSLAREGLRVWVPVTTAPTDPRYFPRTYVECFRLVRDGDSWALDFYASASCKLPGDPFNCGARVDMLAISDYEHINAQTRFVRDGLPPKGGLSHNARDNSLEPGVSVFRAAKIKSGWVIEGNAGGMILGRSKLYEVTGDLLPGTGSDGEPLLANCKVAREIKSFWRFARY